MRSLLFRLLKKLFVAEIAVAVSFLPVFSHQVVLLSFHDSVTVPDTVIRLADIADIEGDIGASQDVLARTMVGETAPPGYSRCITPADLLMYRLMPMFKDIEFKCNKVTRVKIATLGITKRIGDFEKNILGYLDSAGGWNHGQVSVAIQNGNECFHVYDAPMHVSVEGLRSLYLRGHKRLQLNVTQLGRVTRISLECKISVIAPVVVALKAIPRQRVLGMDDIAVRDMDLTDIVGTPCFSTPEALGKRTSQEVLANGIITDRVVESIPLIQKGDPISIEVVKGGTRVSVTAVARENGREGQKIWVENSMTHRLVRVRVSGSGNGQLL